MDGARGDGRWCGRTGRVKIRRRAVDRGRERMKVEGVSWRKVQGGREGVEWRASGYVE